MAKRLIVIASGSTERSALPCLLRHLDVQRVSLVDVRIPARNRRLTPRQANRILRAAWFEMRGRGEPPDKFVVLIDADSQPVDAARAYFGDLANWTRDIEAPVLLAVAKWHLEAWFFADDNGLRTFLGRSVGHVNPSIPDEIQNPKHHLKQLLSEPYTARMAGAIAQRLSPDIIRSRSPSFAQFEQAALNGALANGRTSHRA